MQRDPNNDLGLGTMEVYFGETQLEEFSILTGWQKLNPFELGGITPPIPWRVTESISYRKHPNIERKMQTMARIEPALDDDNTLFSQTLGDRTFGLKGPHDWPFMIHGGRKVTPRPGIPKTSTGCIVVYKDWKYARNLLNAGFYHADKNKYDLIVTVRDIEKNENYSVVQAKAMEARYD